MRLIKYAVVINIVSSSYTLFMGRIYEISPNKGNHFQQIVLYVSFIERVSDSMHCIIFICFVLVLFLGYLVTMRRYIKSLFQRCKWNKYQTTIENNQSVIGDNPVVMLLLRIIKCYSFFKKKYAVTKKMKAKNMGNKVERELMNKL